MSGFESDLPQSFSVRERHFADRPAHVYSPASKVPTIWQQLLRHPVTVVMKLIHNHLDRLCGGNAITVGYSYLSLVVDHLDFGAA